jgi:alkaline phosphatase D
MKQTFNYLLFISLVYVGTSCSNSQNIPVEKEERKLEGATTFCIAFGSCAKQTKKLGILDSVITHQPDLFIFLGDNIYGDTENMNELQAKYDKLAEKAPFQRLRDTTRILATWDDHDYGENDAGKEYPFKEQSKEIFLDFWQEKEDSERRNHLGVYHVEKFKVGRKTVQVILLDTRTFRDGLTPIKDKSTYKNDYQPTISPDSTMLGEVQWTWLEKQFKDNADIRIIASSNQFSHQHNGWESWTNVPHQRQKMLDLIAATRANGIVFLSGDVHWGELSKEPASQNCYPIYDVTSSGLTQDWDSTEPNRNRVGEVVRQTNFGIIELECSETFNMRLKIIDKKNVVRIDHFIEESDLNFEK